MLPKLLYMSLLHMKSVTVTCMKQLIGEPGFAKKQDKEFHIFYASALIWTKK